MTDDVLIEEINAAYRRLSTATEDPTRADRELAEHVRRTRLDDPGGKEREGRLTSTSTACSTPTSIAAWRLTGRGPTSTTSTQGARWTGCT
jgi:hypothetical protein